MPYIAIPLARIGAKAVSVFSLHALGLLLSLFERIWLTWGSVAPPFFDSGSS